MMIMTVQHRCSRIALILLLTFCWQHTSAAELQRIDDFGDNPGDIDMYIHVPDNMPANAPLVVSLHGCRQNASTYANAGWTVLADEWKFYVLYPEQSFTNNAYNCWNWFAAADNHRGEGEAASLMAMINTMRDRFDIDEQRIYIEGLSAGAYMTAVMLAAYPDVFAGGATNAGGPAFCATTEKHFWDPFGWWFLYESGNDAGQCMHGRDQSPEDWGERVEDDGLGDYDGPWPIISIWHGTDDSTVDPANLDELVDQWTWLHDIDRIHDNIETLGPDAHILHHEYQDDHGTVRVETWQVEGMTHGTSIAEEPGERCGRVDDYILDVGICAVRRIGRFWGVND